MDAEHLAFHILADIVRSNLAACRSWEELHEHVDPNLLGTQVRFLGDDTAHDHQTRINRLNAARALVDDVLARR